MTYEEILVEYNTFTRRSPHIPSLTTTTHYATRSQLAIRRARVGVRADYPRCRTVTIHADSTT